jgi:hypothetical protein
MSCTPAELATGEAQRWRKLTVDTAQPKEHFEDWKSLPPSGYNDGLVPWPIA